MPALAEPGCEENVLTCGSGCHTAFLVLSLICAGLETEPLATSRLSKPIASHIPAPGARPAEGALLARFLNRGV